MSDDRIIEYLRSRANVTVPADLIDSVADAVERTPQQRHSWFAPFIPAAAAVGVAGAVLIAALLVGQNPRFGPAPTGGPTAEPTPAPTPAASEMPDPDGSLEPGDSLTIDAVDPDGTWGTIRVERGDDLGGYLDLPVGEDAFVIELFIDYEAERMPEPETFGRDDWTLTTADGQPIGVILEPVAPGTDPDVVPLTTYPGAIDILTTPTEGWLHFEVPRDAADEHLRLIYQPTDLDEPVTAIPVRVPGDAPDWVPPETPAPTPDEVGYVEQEGLPFSVIDSTEADALFDTPDTCTNPEGGYTVTYPDDWYTNTEIGDVPACSWFTPDFYTVTDPGQAPDEIWLSIGVIDATIGYTGLTVVDLNHEVTVGGIEGQRVQFNPNPNDDPPYRVYHYVVELTSQTSERTLVASMDTDSADDYELGKAVLDRIMASLEFTD